MILCPVQSGQYKISQRFGGNPAMYAQFGLIGHNGIDFAPRRKLMKTIFIYAPHEGYVYSGDQGDHGYGKYISIQSLPYNNEGNSRISWLAHLHMPLIETGRYVAMGDVIGIMGNTGFSTARHLHWTYKVKDVNGQYLHKDNGYKGALDILQYVRFWIA